MNGRTTRTRHDRRWAATAGAGIGAIGMLAASFGAASAASGDFQISLSDQVATGSPGQEITLATGQVPSALIGRTCDGSYGSTNNSSVHPNTDLIIRSGGTSVTIRDVEDAAGGTKTSSGPLTLGSTVTVSVVLGPDGIASLGETLVLDCPDVSATTIAATTTMPDSSAPQNTGPQNTGPQNTGPADVGAGGPVPTTVSAQVLPTTGSDDAAPVLLAAATGMVLSGLGARRLSRRRAARGEAR